MKTKTISVAIATFNEQDNIARCLDTVKDWVNEIIIVDGQSTDDTLSIIKRYPLVKLISTTNKPIFHINKQIAIDKCAMDWILQLDADEVVTSNLKNEIIDTINVPDQQFSGYWIKRRNFFLGKFLTKGGIYPDPTVRLYLNGKGHLPCKDIHEQAKIDGQIGWLQHDLLHYSDPTFSRYLLRNDRYTSLLASELLKQKLHLNFFNFLKYFIFKPIHWFFLAFFLHRGYIDGFPGFIFAWYSSLRFPLAYIKLYEQNKL